MQGPASSLHHTDPQDRDRDRDSDYDPNHHPAGFPVRLLAAIEQVPGCRVGLGLGLGLDGYEFLMRSCWVNPRGRQVYIAALGAGLY